MVLLLTVLSGIAWTIVYIDSIRVGFKQKTYAMPIARARFEHRLGMDVRGPRPDTPQLQAWVNII
jgi:hypothetical protein